MSLNISIMSPFGRIVNDWVNRFYAQGLEGLKEKPCTALPSRLNKAQLVQLSEYIRNNSIKESGGRLNAQGLVNYSDREFKLNYVDSIY
jgi:transposase